MTDDPTQAAELLWSLAGPRGPLRPDGEDEAQRRALMSGEPTTAAKRLFSILSSCTPPAGIAIEDVEIEVADLLSLLITQPGVAEQLVEALDVSSTRGAVLDATALNGNQQVGLALVSIVDQHSYTDWGDRDLIGLAAALGAVATDAAYAAIAALDSQGGWSAAVQGEIDLAAEGSRASGTGENP